MSGGFQHDIAGGDGKLTIVALMSPDYVPGTSGWAIFKDGNAEFNSGTFRGTLHVGSGLSIDFEGSAYNPSGTDASVYAVPATGPSASSFLVFASATDDTAQAIIELAGQSEDGTVDPYIHIFQANEGGPSTGLPVWLSAPSSQPGPPSGSDTAYYAWNGALASTGGMLGLTPAGSLVRLRGVSADTSSTTVTQTSYTQFTRSWAIPASDPKAGSGYRLACWGNGTWGSTQRQLNMRGNFTGAGGLGAVAVSSTFINASEAFAWYFETQIILTGTGISAGYASSSRLNISQTANPATPGTTADNAMGMASIGSSSSGINTGSAMTMWAEAEWGGSGASLTCTGSTFEPIGP